MSRELVKLIEVEGMIHARIIESKLKHFKIPCMLKYDSATNLYGITLNGLGKVEIIVPKKYLIQAQNLIKEE